MSWAPKATYNGNRGSRSKNFSKWGKSMTQSVTVGFAMAGAGEGKLAHVTLTVFSWGLLAEDKVG